MMEGKSMSDDIVEQVDSKTLDAAERARYTQFMPLKQILERYGSVQAAQSDGWNLLSQSTQMAK